MTPGARVAAAIVILDDVLAGRPAEQALIGWARSSRFAGSGDRAAVRDHVFGALRRRRSATWVGGAETGRGLMIGVCRLDGIDPGTLFTGEGHAPQPLTAPEEGQDLGRASDAVRADLPDWLWDRFQHSLGPAALGVALTLRARAPVFLRVNLLKCDIGDAQGSLAEAGIETRVATNIRTALEVTALERKIAKSAAYLTGQVEVQDAASQAAILALPLRDGLRVLDYCAGGGGKSLAMAALAQLQILAHDALPQRMADLPGRAVRAGASIALASTAELAMAAQFDLVLVDAPCSGSGTWRRSPDAKWRLTPDALARLLALQARILRDAVGLVRPGGVLAYATCSVLAEENAAQVDSFLRDNPRFYRESGFQLWPGPDGDGFFLAVLRHA